MACPIKIRKQINQKIESIITPGRVYDEKAVRTAVNRTNSIWNKKVLSLSLERLGGAKAVLNDSEIEDLVSSIYNSQLKSEGVLENKILTRVRLIYSENPFLKEIGTLDEYYDFIKKELSDKSLGDISFYKYAEQFKTYKNKVLEQFKPLTNKFFTLLAEYNSNSLGIIPSTENIINLQDSLDKEFPGLFEINKNSDGDYFISRVGEYNNIVEEEGKKVISKVFSKSISEKSGVPSQVIKAANKLSNRFKSKINIVSEKQAWEIFPNLRLGTTGFFNPKTNISYIIYERMGNTTLLHEAFSHPFIIYIKQNYNGLYQTLLQKAKDNTKVKSEVDTYYSKYNKVEKEMEYIAHAIDLEINNQLKDPSLLKSINRFWERIINYIKNLFGIKQDINKLTTFKDVVNFVLNSKEKIDLTNLELMDLKIMESFINLDEDSDFDNINEPNLESRSIIDNIREDVADYITKMQNSIQKMKEAIVSGEIELSTGEKDQIDTITSRVITLSKDLFQTSRTKDLLKKDKNLSLTIQYFSNIIKGSLNSETALTEQQELLKSLSNISQVIEEALVLTRYINEQMEKAKDSSDPIEVKQREIHQYYQIMQAIESSLKELYDFYIKTDRQKDDNINPVIQVINAIFSDIKNAKDINSKYIIDYWAERIMKVTDVEGNNKLIDEEIEDKKERIKRRLQRLKNAKTDKERDRINKEISEINLYIEKQKQSRVTLENIKATINGDYGDSSYLYYKFMAAFNSPDLLISGVDRVIEQHYMKTSDDTAQAINEMNRILKEYLEATGFTDSSKFNLETFSSPLIRKATLNKVKTKIKHETKTDDTTMEVVETESLEEFLEEVYEDVLLNKFKVQELNSKLKELEFYRNQAFRSKDPVKIQKANKDLHDFREKYFITAVTEEFNKRTMNSNLITEEDIQGLYDEEGNPLSLEKDPDLIYAAKAVLEPLYEKEDAYSTIAKARIPTDIEIEDYQENQRKIKEASSYEILGTTTKKTGKEMAIARAINRSRELKRGVFNYTIHESAKAKYFDSYARQKKAIQNDINSGKLTESEGKKEMNKWHKLHSKITLTQEFFDTRNNLTKKLDEFFKILSEDENFNFIEKFGFEDQKNTKKQTLDALWSEIYDYLNPLKDIEGVVDGRLANEDLQKKIKSNIEIIEKKQRQSESILKLNNSIDYELFFKAIKKGNAYTTTSKGTAKKVETYTEKEGSLKSDVSTADFTSKGFNTLSKILSSVDDAKYIEFINGEEEIFPISDEDKTIIKKYLFRSSPYAEKYALALKIELAKDESLTPEERKEKLKLKLNEEYNNIINDDSIEGAYKEYASKLNNSLFKKLNNYNKAVGDIFDKISKLTERETTEYYDITVKNMKSKLFIDNYENLMENYKKQISYYSKNLEEQAELNLTLDLINRSNYYKYPKLVDAVNKLFKKTEWFNNNHYSKLMRGGVIQYFATPLWTQSNPTDDSYKSIEPNNSYRTRSVNEFLIDKNGNPTDIRLKRGDTKIIAKEGDTLDVISQTYGIELKELRRLNPLLIGQIKEGEEVVLKKFGSKVFGRKEPREYLEDGSLSEYIDPEYKRLQKENPKLISVIDKLNDIFYRYQEKSGTKGLELFQIIPRIEVQGWEVFLDKSGPTVKKIWRKTKNLVETTPQDFDSGYGRADFSDKILESVPLKFVSDIPYELRSKDVFGNIIKFIAHVNEIAELNILLPTTTELHRIVDENSPAVKKEGRIKKRKNIFNVKKDIIIREKAGNIRADHLLHIRNSKILGEKVSPLTVGNWNVTKTISNFSSGTSMTTLGGFITPNIVMNYIVGKVQIWIEVWSGGILDRDDYNKGLKRFYNYMFTDFNNDFYKLGEKSITGQLLNRYNPSSKTSLEMFGNELKKTPIKDYASMDIFFKTRRLAEFELAGGPTLGILDKYKVLDNEKEISLADAYVLDENGNINLKNGLKKLNGQDFTREDEDMIRIKISQINMIIQGNYSSHHKTQFDTTTIGTLVSYFRKHLPSYAEKAWSSRHFNYSLGAYVEGYQRKLWGTALQMSKAIRNGNQEELQEAILEAKLDWKKDSTLKKAAVHNGILGLIYVLLAIIGSEDDDDNKKTHSYDSFFAKAMIYQLMRLKSDLELASAIPFIAGLNESLNIIKSPSIVIDKTVVNLIKLTSHIIEYGEYKLGLVPEKDVILSRDYYGFDKGQLKILRDLGKLTGVTGATFNPDEMVKNVKNINSALFR